MKNNNTKCKCSCVTELITDTKELLTSNLKGCEQYYKNVLKLNEWEEAGILELYAGDSYINDIPEHYANEDRYTINHYYRCKTCGRVYFIGFCCRGSLIFKAEEFPTKHHNSVEDIDFEHIMTGKEMLGVRFNNKKRFR